MAVSLTLCAQTRDGALSELWRAYGVRYRGTGFRTNVAVWMFFLCVFPALDCVVHVDAYVLGLFVRTECVRLLSCDVNKYTSSIGVCVCSGPMHPSTHQSRVCMV